MAAEDGLSVLAKSLMAGGLASMCGKTTVAPLDRLKILFQAQSKGYANLGVVASLVRMVREEGVLALYKGNGAQMVRIFPYGAIQFSAYELFKRMSSLNERWKDSHTVKFLSGSLGGICAVSATFPLDTIRAKLAFQVQGESRYRGILGTGRAVLGEGGLSALYRGLLPSLIGTAPNAGLTFYSFEQLKQLLLDYCAICRVEDVDGRYTLSVPGKLLCGGLAGALAQTVSYPLDVARRRMQLGQFQGGMVEAVRETYRQNGIVKGLYRGLSVNYLRSVPLVAVTFSVYEVLKQHFGLQTSIKITAS